MRLKPQEMSDVVTEKKAIHPMAAQGLVVMPETFRMTP
jgi:hypothetical protein